MKRAHSISKQVIAFLLLGIFVSIQAVKMLHSHTNAAATQFLVDGKMVDKKGDCNICDYHLAKDSTVEAVAFEMLPPFAKKASKPFYKHPPFSSVGLYYADRGPPAKA